MAKKREYRPTYIRAWREYRRLSLDELAARVPMDKGNLSKVERGKLPYNQDTLELIATALGVDEATLLTRDPTAPTPIWSLWDRADTAQRRQIESVAEALIDAQKRRA